MPTGVAALHFTAGSANAVCTIKAGDIAGQNGPATLQELCDLVGDTFQTHVMPGLCSDLKFVKCSISGVNPVQKTYNQVGGSASAMTTINTALLVKKISANARPGRMYLPGVSETGVSPDGTLVGSLIVATQDRLNNWRNAMELAGAGFAVEHKGDFDSNVESFLVEAKVGTQRRRLRR